jgi:hypothetical protein
VDEVTDMPASGGAATGTFSIMVVSLFSGLLSGLTASVTDVLATLNQHLTPATASLIGAVVVGGFSVGARELVGLVKWLVERRQRRKDADR